MCGRARSDALWAGQPTKKYSMVGHARVNGRRLRQPTEHYCVFGYARCGWGWATNTTLSCWLWNPQSNTLCLAIHGVMLCELGNPQGITMCLAKHGVNYSVRHTTGIPTQINLRIIVLGNCPVELCKISRPVSPFSHSILSMLISDIHIVVLEQPEQCVQVWECV